MVLVLFAVVFASLNISASSQKSGTWDEPIHIASGFAAWTEGDYRIDPEHPPLLRMWAALPLALGVVPGVTIDTSPVNRTDPTVWARTLYPLCQKFLYADNDADRVLFAARAMVLLFGLGTGVLVFAWASEWLGFWPAVAALGLYAIEPNLSAHASFVTTDAGAAFFIFGTVYCLWRSCRRLSIGNVSALFVFFALAIAAKFSALILGPIIAVLLARASFGPLRMPARTAMALIAGLALAAWFGVWAIYGFRHAPSRSASWVYQLQTDALVQKEVPGLARVITWVDAHRLLPNVFSQGFLFSQAKAQTRRAYFMGEYSDRGWWYYFPAAFLLKTPIAHLALFAIGLGVLVWRRRRLGLDNIFFVAVPAALFLAAAMSSGINIGLRHILPIYPFVLLIAAVAAQSLLEARAGAARVALGVAALGGAVEFGAVYPDNLAFFNRFAGGPDNGSAYLVDSNLDWGQDLKPLKQWMTANGVAHVNLAYFGTASPRYYGINSTALPGSNDFVEAAAVYPTIPGYVAVSETVLSGVYLDMRAHTFYQKIRDRPPLARIGHSIRVYRVEEPWW
jgi:hypothetical protein